MLNRRGMLAGLMVVTSTTVIADTQVPFPVGITWVADRLGETHFASVSQPILKITPEGQAQGNAGCNRYTGPALIRNDQLTLGPLAMTRMACFGAGGDNERLFAPAISTATSWRMEGRALVIETTSGALRFRRR